VQAFEVAAGHMHVRAREFVYGPQRCCELKTGGTEGDCGAGRGRVTNDALNVTVRLHTCARVLLASGWAGGGR